MHNISQQHNKGKRDSFSVIIGIIKIQGNIYET